jgi:hypothetical protein
MMLDELFTTSMVYVMIPPRWLVAGSAFFVAVIGVGLAVNTAWSHDSLVALPAVPLAPGAQIW